MESVGIMVTLFMMVVLLLVAHHDSIVSGDEQDNDGVYVRGTGHCRVSAVPTSGMFYDQERDV